MLRNREMFFTPTFLVRRFVGARTMLRNIIASAAISYTIRHMAKFLVQMRRMLILFILIIVRDQAKRHSNVTRSRGYQLDHVQ